MKLKVVIPSAPVISLEKENEFKDYPEKGLYMIGNINTGDEAKK